jgi:hypothetical protein
MVGDGSETDLQFARVVDSMAERFAGVRDRDTVSRVVDETRARLEQGARVAKYLPILTARPAADLLAGRESAPGPDLPSAIVSTRGGAMSGFAPVGELNLRLT